MASSADFSDSLTARPGRYGLARATLAALGLLVAVLSVHVWSLWDGTVLDDYWHQKGLREHGWSPGELLRTLEIEPAKFVHLWWQDVTVRWEYARPLFILCMKVCYVVIGGNDPLPLHAFSIVLHLASTLMVWRLAWRLTQHRFWSFAGGLLFAIYPHAVVTVAWPSSQNVVLQTALGLGALFAWINASRLEIGGGTPIRTPIRTRVRTRSASDGVSRGTNDALDNERLSTANTTPLARARGSDVGSDSETNVAPQMCRRWLTTFWTLWLLSLLSRENALLLPGIFAAFELAFGGWRRLWLRKWHFVAMGIAGIAFVAWRVSVVTHGMPDVYIRRPDGDLAEYSAWLLAKFLHYFVTSIWLAPMTIGPTGRFNPWTEVPGDCALMLAFLIGVGGVYWLTARRAAGWWIWPLWIVLAVLPVLPVVATPHSGYMSGVAVGIGWALAATCATRSGSAALLHFGRGVAIFFLIGFAIMSMWNRWQWTATIATERYVHAWVKVSPPPPPTRDVFFINLPFMNIYVKPGLVQALGPSFESVDVSVLAYAPDPVLIEQRSIVEQLDAHRFSLEIEGQPYFSRLLGRFLLDGFGGRGQFTAGEIIRGKKFDIEIVAADAEGMRKMIFTFPRPLSDPSYCFYVTTPDVAAGRLRFSDGAAVSSASAPSVESPMILDAAIAELERGHAAAAESLFAAARNSDAAIAAPARAALVRVAKVVARGRAAPVQRQLDDDQLSDADLPIVESWWRGNVTDATLAELWLRRDDFNDYIEGREELPHARMWVAKLFVRSDLYLTGPPFPGPRPRRPR
ncbi:MAG: hypothetical protein ACKVS9_08265 [Phycisphaerae bacterium]